MDTTQRQSQARTLMASPLLKEIFKDISDTVFKQWQSEPNPEKRDGLWYQLNGVKLVQARIENELREILR